MIDSSVLSLQCHDVPNVDVTDQCEEAELSSYFTTVLE